MSATIAADSGPPAAARERLPLDRGWRFHQGDIPFPVITGHSASYNNAKAGRAWGAAASDYDDTAWRELDLPLAENDQNSWTWFRIGQLQAFPNGIWAIFRGWFTPPAPLRTAGGRLHFTSLTGRAQFWINGELVAKKETFAAAPFSVPFPLARVSTRSTSSSKPSPASPPAWAAR